MTSDAPSQGRNAVRRLTWMEVPRILATFLVVGFGSLVVVGFFLLPQLDQALGEALNSMYRRDCLRAQSTLNAIPAEQRLSQWPVVGRLPPNLVVIDMSALDDSHGTLRAALTEPHGEIVRTFVLREDNAPLTDGADDYTIESTTVYLAMMKTQRRHQWLLFFAVWFTTTGLFTWQQWKRYATTQSENESRYSDR